MKILFLFDYYFPYIGGAEVVNMHIAEYFNKKNEVTVCSKGFNGFFGRKDTVNGVCVYRFLNVFRIFHSIICFFCAFNKAYKSDLIFCATYASGLTGRWLSCIFNKRSVILVHEVLSENWKYFKKFHFLYYFYEKYIVTQKFDLYIAVSHYTKKRLVEYGIPDEKIKVVHNGVEEELFCPRPINTELREKVAGDAKLVYLFYGRPGGSKGLEYLRQAVPEIYRNEPDSRLVLILGKEPQNEYKMFMETLNLSDMVDKITILPSMPRDELPDYINIADVVVIPSLSEGFGFSAAEACAIGKKVVITDAGSLPEVVHGKVVIVKKADPDALAEGVLKAYRGECQDIPEKRFSWNDALITYDEAVKNLVSV